MTSSNNKENMKKNLIYAAALLAGITAIQACQKEPVTDLTGTYTYKTSGTVTLEYVDPGNGEKTTHIMNLVNEEGQMTLAGTTSGELLIACNAIGGDAYTFTGSLNDAGTLLINGNPEKHIFVKSASLTVGHGNVRFSGSGKLYDDILAFSCEYMGTVTVAGVGMSIIGSDVEIVAKRNK